jgi:hypothetical protein
MEAMQTNNSASYNGIIYIWKPIFLTPNNSNPYSIIFL